MGLAFCALGLIDIVIYYLPAFPIEYYLASGCDLIRNSPVPCAGMIC